jgi:hypothetical protein
VKRAIDVWMHPPGLRHGRDLAQLLASMHTLVAYIPSAEAVWDTSASATTTSTSTSTGSPQPVSLATAKPIEVSVFLKPFLLFFFCFYISI